MPTPGPRNQFGPDPGYRNPEAELPSRWNPWLWPEPIVSPGRSPGTSVLTLRGMVLAPGTIRRFWRQAINYAPAMAPYSWTKNAPGPGRPVIAPDGFQITRALRYMTRNLYMGANIDNTRYAGLHTPVPPRKRAKLVTLGRGQTRSRPTTRNRMTSFGSRVQSLNTPVPASEA